MVKLEMAKYSLAKCENVLTFDMEKLLLSELLLAIFVKHCQKTSKWQKRFTLLANGYFTISTFVIIDKIASV